MAGERKAKSEHERILDIEANIAHINYDIEMIAEKLSSIMYKGIFGWPPYWPFPLPREEAPNQPEPGGGTVPGSTTLPAGAPKGEGTPLTHCTSYAAFKNREKIPAPPAPPAPPRYRTVEVRPVGRGGKVPPGVTTFVAPIPAAGQPNPKPNAATNGPHTIPPEGDANGYPVPAGSAIWVHYNRPPKGGTRLRITQS